MNYLLLTRDGLDIGSINDLASSALCGATYIFVGRPGDHFEGNQIISVQYEVQSESVVMKEMEQICAELRDRWADIVNIVIHHRVGLVSVNESNVAIAVSSPHRNSALDAIKLASEEVEKRVSIRKKEISECGGYRWKNNKLETNSTTFDETLCEIQDTNPLPTKFVQIAATETEISRRIKSFVDRKREEIDLNNVMDYIGPNAKDLVAHNEQDAATSCARINCSIVKQENSKCHLKVRQTDNKMGPQTRHDYLHTLDNLMENTYDDGLDNTTKDACLQRTEVMEDYLSIGESNKKYHQRLKDLESRILYLESICPEYHNDLVGKIFYSQTVCSNKKRKMSD